MGRERVVALLPLIFVTACTGTDPRAEAEQLVKAPDLVAARAALPGTADQVLGVPAALTWLESGGEGTEDSCGMRATESHGFFPTQRWAVRAAP